MKIKNYFDIGKNFSMKGIVENKNLIMLDIGLGLYKQKKKKNFF